MSHKPAGYPTVSPYLLVDGAHRTITFLTRAFDAVELRRFPDASGRLVHADEVNKGHTQIALIIRSLAPRLWPLATLHCAL